MWTLTTVPDVGEPLKVNHVVWLAERQQPEVEVVDEGSYDTHTFPPSNVSSSPQNDVMTDVVDADDLDTQVSLCSGVFRIWQRGGHGERAECKPITGVRRQSPLKLKHFLLLNVQWKPQIRPFF